MKGTTLQNYQVSVYFVNEIKSFQTCFSWKRRQRKLWKWNNFKCMSGFLALCNGAKNNMYDVLFEFFTRYYLTFKSTTFNYMLDFLQFLWPSQNIWTLNCKVKNDFIPLQIGRKPNKHFANLYNLAVLELQIIQSLHHNIRELHQY